MPILPFSLPGCVIQHVAVFPTGLTITAQAITPTATCPSCQQVSHRLHSYYTRTPQDLPVSGQCVRLVLRVRRFCCLNPSCERRTFVEALPTIVARYARHTLRLGSLLDGIAFALSAQAGERLLKRMGMSVSAETLLRRVKRVPLDPIRAPRLLGVDDFALHRGQSYGTILVDLTTHCPIDLLADRSAETFAQWLREHPGVEVISRDRAGNYAEGGRAGAPDALQIADRWHLVHNLAEALDQILKRTLALHQKPAQEPEPEPEPSDADLRLSASQKRRREQAQESYRQVQSLYEQGKSLQEIASVVGIDKNTLRYFVQSQPWGRPPGERGRKPGGAQLAPYLPYLHKRWKEGCRNGMQLWRELCGRGYTGSASSVRPYLALLRQVPDPLRPTGSPRRKVARTKKALSTRRIIHLVLAQTEQVTQEQQQELEQVSHLHPEIVMAFTQAKAFVRMMREQDVEGLAVWLSDASTQAVRELRAFAKGIERDRTAVEAAFSREESNGQTEGQITRLKLLKQSMYGRASFPLLRQRVLHASE